MFTRIARVSPECIYVDLGRPEYNAVEITPEGWSIVDNPPVRFRRPKGFGALDIPIETDKSLEEALGPFVNVQGPGDQLLFYSLLCSPFWPEGPFAVTQLHGAAGSAKTTLGRVLQRCIDPNAGDLQGRPGEERDIAIYALNTFLLCYDNISHIEPGLADILCRVSSGGGFQDQSVVHRR